jgi:hypothetical protein
MGTQVYITGSTITVAKAGQSAIKIPVERAKYVLQGFTPISNISDYTSVSISDIVTEVATVSDTVDIQDSTGALVGDTAAVKSYFDGFFQMGAFKALSNDLATSANQEIIIAQNATIEAEINETTENTRDLKRIKDLTKDTNKILTKIYN